MRILLVEDDADLAQFVGKGLKEERYAVDVAADGEQGLQLATEHPYGLLILDIMLPLLDGLTLCRRVRAEGITAPVLLLTAVRGMLVCTSVAVTVAPGTPAPLSSVTVPSSVPLAA